MIVYSVLYEGSQDDVAPYAAPFEAIKPLNSTSFQVPYNKLNKAVGTSMTDGPCLRVYNTKLYPINILRYNATAMRNVYNIYSEVVKDPRFQLTGFLLESYGNKAVRAVDEKSTAVAREEREKNLLA